MEILAEDPCWIFAASTVEDGNLTPPRELVDDVDSDVARSYITRVREIFCEIFPQDIHVVCCRQQQGADIVEVRDRDKNAFNNTDGLVTMMRDVALVTYGSDCPSVCVVDMEARAIGLCHSGRAGTIHGIASELMKRVEIAANVLPDQVRAMIGPGICGACYEVRDVDVVDVRERFVDCIVKTREGHVSFDITNAIQHRLLNDGIESKNIQPHGGCTFEQPNRWFSFRRDRIDGQQLPSNQQIFVAFLK